jgi:hypothetical protein
LKVRVNRVAPVKAMVTRDKLPAAGKERRVGLGRFEQPRTDRESVCVAEGPWWCGEKEQVRDLPVCMLGHGARATANVDGEGKAEHAEFGASDLK